MAAKRLTRKEIVKEDAIQKTLTQTSGWLVENRNALLIAFLVLIGLLVVIFFYRDHVQSTREASQAAFAEALSIYHAPIAGQDSEEIAASEDSDSTVPPPEPEYQFESESERNKEALTAFQEVAEEYSGYEVASFARYYLGLLHYRGGDIEAANRELNAVLTEADSNEIRNLARNLRAEIAYAREQPEEAIQYLNQIAEETSTNFPVETILMRLGRIYEEIGKPEEALGAYRRVTTEYAGTAAAQEAQTRVQELEATLGESSEGTGEAPEPSATPEDNSAPQSEE